MLTGYSTGLWEEVVVAVVSLLSISKVSITNDPFSGSL